MARVADSATDSPLQQLIRRFEASVFDVGRREARTLIEGAEAEPRGVALEDGRAREEPHGLDGFWTRLRELSPHCLFVWGRNDKVVPAAFARHVEDVLSAATHLELDCGHVPQLERPKQTHAAIERFLDGREP